MTKQNNQTITLIWNTSRSFPNLGYMTAIIGTLHFRIKGTDSINYFIDSLQDNDETTINLVFDDEINKYDKVFSSIKMFKSWLHTYNFKKEHGWI